MTLVAYFETCITFGGITSISVFRRLSQTNPNSSLFLHIFCLFYIADNEGKKPTLPTSPPEKVVEFAQTTDYHWPQFDLNNTDLEATGSSLTVLGPFQFKNAVELDKSKEKVK